MKQAILAEPDLVGREHELEELQAFLGVFDGEIRVSKKEAPEGIKQTLRVRKLVNQKHQENEIPLTKEKLSS